VVKKAAAVFSPWGHCSYDFVHAFLASPKNHCFFPPTPRFHALLLLTELLSHSHITEIPSRKRRRFPYRATRAAARPCMHACAQLRARRVCWWILPVGNHMHGDGTEPLTHSHDLQVYNACGSFQAPSSRQEPAPRPQAGRGQVTLPSPFAADASSPVGRHSACVLCSWCGTDVRVQWWGLSAGKTTRIGSTPSLHSVSHPIHVCAAEIDEPRETQVG